MIIRTRLQQLLPSPFKSLHTGSVMAINVDLRDYRQPYKEDADALLEKDLPSRDPVQLFNLWFQDAKACKTILEPNAVCISTATKSGVPSSRMVLLKGFGSDGFKIFTYLSSRKGQELEQKENPEAALLFYWDPMNKQVRIEGHVELLPESEAVEYFARRPKRSQLGAAASDQSQVIDSRDSLIKRYSDLEEKHADTATVPKPEHWGGIKVVPRYFEFWQGQSSRLHDRIIFRKARDGERNAGGTTGGAADGAWIMERLQP